MTRIVRYILTIALLWRVWTHADWSVALCITGLSIVNEIQARLNDERGTLLTELCSKFIESKTMFHGKKVGV